MNKLRRVTEAEVVAEFLKNEFYEPEFHRDRKRFERLVVEADLTNETENALRLALLFRRRAILWRELPSDTQWWEVQLEPADVNKVRVFPRAQWRRLASGSFLATDVVDRLRRAQVRERSSGFYSKIQSLSYRLRQESDNSSVMLIATDPQSLSTLIEGNHRFTAAMLAGSDLVTQRFRVYCGFSPRMTECCWYKTSLPNLWRYAKNRFRNIVDKEADVERVLAATAQRTPAPATASAGQAGTTALAQKATELK
ncbi:MAG TPA: hypothetical protein VE825_10960 [Terriglobales bacterium]|nr:hypothetical protein [Terriglobales bacterium]